MSDSYHERLYRMFNAQRALAQEQVHTISKYAAVRPLNALERRMQSYWQGISDTYGAVINTIELEEE
jgi:hypothetical protein